MSDTKTHAKAWFAAAGGGGVFVGILLAVILAPSAPRATLKPVGPGAAAPEVTLDPAPPTDSEIGRARAAAQRAAVLAARVRQVAAAHARLHADDAPADGDLTDALKDAIRARYPGDDNVEFRRMLTELAAEHGIGRMARGGRITPVGAAILARLGELERHALDPAPYDRAPVQAAVAALDASPSPPSPDPSPPPASAGAESAVLAALLEAPTFDANRTATQLATLSALPGDDDIAAAEATARAETKDALGPGDVPADVALMATALQLVLDYKFVRRAGPSELRKAATVLTRKRDRRAVRKLMDGVLGAASGDAAMALIDPAHPQYAPMVEIHDRYRKLADAGGCAAIPGGWKFRPGAKSEEVKRIQERLACEGYYDGEIDGVYEGLSLLAAKTYQRHHELKAEGLIFKETIASLNVPMSRRAEQIALVLQRMRESPIAEVGDFYIRVNLPAFELAVWDLTGDAPAVVRRHKVIVGTNRLDDDKRALIQGHLNRTKLMVTELYKVIVNPAWILPPRVEHGELKGKIAEDPTYLEKHNIKQHTLDNGRKVYIQGYGEGNVLGTVKFLLKESNAIYLHDTDKPELFKHAKRDFSHGCVRVQHAKEFGEWVLTRAGFTEKEIAKSFKLQQYQRGYDLKEPIPLITEYMTVDIAEDGLPVFLTDIYKYDRAFFRGTLPPTVTTRWGAAELRPRWVPRVSEETVAQWRSKGMAAPRNYDPAVHGP